MRLATTFDPVSLEIMWSRLINITEECWVTIWRTAFSTIIGEAQDFGCELLDARANSIAHSPRSMPVFNLTLPEAVKALFEAFPPDDLVDGDVLITNDPWVCAGHLFDLAVVTPVFRKRTVVGLVGSIGHCSDIGGTKDSGRAREVYEEGLQIPPLKLYRAGHLNTDLAAMIRHNVRRPQMVFGDVQAQVSSNRVGAQRLLEFMDEYGLETLEPLAHEVQQRAEAAMREAIAAVPDGSYTSESEFEVAGRRLRLPCRVIVEGDALTVDWDGAPPELPYGGVNCTAPYTAAHTTYALKSILTPDIPSNAGCFRPMQVRAPEGSILNCRYPASVNQRTMVGWFCGPAIFRALAPVLPGRVQAFTGLPGLCAAYGRDAQDRTYNDHIMFGGGQGGGQQVDGNSALLYPTSAGNVPVEMFEQRTPLLVERKELLPDSGGPGFHRGGLGQQVVIRKLYDDGLPVQAQVLPHGVRSPMEGLLGGRRGGQAGYRIAGSILTHGEGLTQLADLRLATDVVVIEAAGGSGYGDPSTRPLDLIARDLAEGYVTRAGLAPYGVRVSGDGRLTRTERARSRPPRRSLRRRRLPPRGGKRPGRPG